jgi:molybdopterin-guanine dinucleotide biosynthesis protein A
MRSGIILSGGKSSRLGRDKGLVELDDKPLVYWVIDRLRDVTDEIIVTVGSEAALPHYRAVVPDDVCVISDCYQENSPLIGLISGLREARGEYAAVCACDMPFIDPTILEMMFCISYGLNGTQLVKSNGWIEPIPSVYNVSKCLRHAEDLRESGEMRIRKVLETMTDVVKLPVEKLRKIDPELVSFNDLDTLDSLEAARRLILNTSS